MDMTSGQRDVLRQLESVTDNFAREWDPARGVLSFARADSLVRAVPGATAAMPRGELLRAFLSRYPGLFGPDDIMDTLRPQAERTDAVGFTHQVFQQVAPPPPLPTTGEPTGLEPVGTGRRRR
ncbi:MAG TPA: hypothetical protein VFM01_09120, partial [Nakamurella sp.]|nr:hypothetical protein [Nakamurella sp.]